MQQEKHRARLGLESLEARETPSSCLASQAALALPGLYASQQVIVQGGGAQGGSQGGTGGTQQGSSTQAGGSSSNTGGQTATPLAASPLTAQQLATQFSSSAAHSLSTEQALHGQFGSDLSAYQNAAAGSTAQAQAKDQLFIDLGGEQAVSALAQAQLPQTYQAATDLATNNALTGSQAVGVSVGLLEATQDTNAVAQIATQDGTYLVSLFPNG